MGKENLYVVEEILDRKTVAKKTLYLVKWEGYGPEENTWEPLINVKKTIALAEFEKLHPPEKRANLSIRSDSVKRSRSTEDMEADNSTVDQLGDSQIAAEDEGESKRESISPMESINKRVKSPSPTRENSDVDTFNTKRVRRTDGSPRLAKLTRETKKDGSARIPPYEGPLPPSPTLTAVSTDMPTSTTNNTDDQEASTSTNGLIDISKVASTQPNKSLVPESILGVFPRKKSLYCLVEWKNAANQVQILDADYMREHYPQMLIAHLLAERAAKPS